MQLGRRTGGSVSPHVTELVPLQRATKLGWLAFTPGGQLVGGHNQDDRSWILHWESLEKEPLGICNVAGEVSDLTPAPASARVAFVGTPRRGIGYRASDPSTLYVLDLRTRRCTTIATSTNELWIGRVPSPRWLHDERAIEISVLRPRPGLRRRWFLQRYDIAKRRCIFEREEPEPVRPNELRAPDGEYIVQAGPRKLAICGPAGMRTVTLNRRPYTAFVEKLFGLRAVWWSGHRLVGHWMEQLPVLDLSTGMMRPLVPPVAADGAWADPHGTGVVVRILDRKGPQWLWGKPA